jgi:hypothetical protein
MPSWTNKPNNHALAIKSAECQQQSALATHLLQYAVPTTVDATKGKAMMTVPFLH